eukprot:31502-Pelagococcus_subviridis.AAC.18
MREQRQLRKHVREVRLDDAPGLRPLVPALRRDSQPNLERGEVRPFRAERFDHRVSLRLERRMLVEVAHEPNEVAHGVVEPGAVAAAVVVAPRVFPSFAALRDRRRLRLRLRLRLRRELTLRLKPLGDFPGRVELLPAPLLHLVQELRDDELFPPQQTSARGEPGFPVFLNPPQSLRHELHLVHLSRILRLHYPRVVHVADRLNASLRGPEHRPVRDVPRGRISDTITRAAAATRRGSFAVCSATRSNFPLIILWFSYRPSIPAVFLSFGSRYGDVDPVNVV